MENERHEGGRRDLEVVTTYIDSAVQGGALLHEQSVHLGDYGGWKEARDPNRDHPQHLFGFLDFRDGGQHPWRRR